MLGIYATPDKTLKVIPDGQPASPAPHTRLGSVPLLLQYSCLLPEGRDQCSQGSYQGGNCRDCGRSYTPLRGALVTLTTRRAPALIPQARRGAAVIVAKRIVHVAPFFGLMRLPRSR